MSNFGGKNAAGDGQDLLRKLQNMQIGGKGSVKIKKRDLIFIFRNVAIRAAGSRTPGTLSEAGCPNGPKSVR